ncbi:MAG: tripartite tricarboxylate transporter substrate-binding protein, partial [Burkholderiaceae bacterium]
SNNWYALFTNAQVPAATVAELNQAVHRTLADPAVLDKLRKSGTDPMSSSPAELRELLHRDMAKWAQLIKAKNIKAE